MNHLQTKHVFLLFSGFILLLTACGTTDPSRFYLLTAHEDLLKGQQEMGIGEDVAIEIGPVTLPEYLDRPQIVTRMGQNKIVLAEFDRWAEPLDDNFARVLLENLSCLLSTDQITVFPYKGSMNQVYRIAVDVSRFDADEHGSVTFSARWTIFRETGETLLRRKTEIVKQDAEKGNYQSIVQSKSGTLADFCREIAEAVSGLAREETGSSPAGGQE
jgi:uncharacterized lipoprotein YmbA